MSWIQAFRSTVERCSRAARDTNRYPRSGRRHAAGDPALMQSRAGHQPVDHRLDLGTGLWPPRRVLLQAAPKQVPHHPRSRRREGTPLRLALEDLGDRRRRGIGGKCFVPRQHLEQHAAKGPDVGAGIDRQPPRLLGAHVGRRAQHGADACVARLRRCLGGADASVRRGGLGQAEVQHLDDAGRRHFDVGGLQVPVNDRLLVRRCQRRDDLAGDLQRFPQRQPASADPVGERAPVHQLQHQRLPVADSSSP